jgi:hypothetical protein
MGFEIIRLAEKNGTGCNNNWKTVMDNKRTEIQRGRLEMAGYLKELGYGA